MHAHNLLLFLLFRSLLAFRTNEELARPPALLWALGGGSEPMRFAGALALALALALVASGAATSVSHEASPGRALKGRGGKGRGGDDEVAVAATILFLLAV